MITGNKQGFVARCRERGYTLDEVRACIVSEDGDQITVDVDHPAYPREPKPGFVPPPPPETPEQQPDVPQPMRGGPGTELKRLLARVGITSTPTCSCNAKAREMDAWGPDECERPERIEEVLAVMRQHARARGLPFLDAAGRILIRRAIKNARRAAYDPSRNP